MQVNLISKNGEMFFFEYQKYRMQWMKTKRMVNFQPPKQQSSNSDNFEFDQKTKASKYLKTSFTRLSKKNGS